jgi:hypothetical protein
MARTAHGPEQIGLAMAKQTRARLAKRCWGPPFRLFAQAFSPKLVVVGEVGGLQPGRWQSARLPRVGAALGKPGNACRRRGDWWDKPRKGGCTVEGRTSGRVHCSRR